MTREEAIERFNGIINAMSISIAQAKFYPSKAELDELCDMAIEALSEPTGEWVECSGTVNGEDVEIDEWQEAKCSACGKWHTTPYMYYFDNFNFCPNCGARMKGGDTE